MFVGYLFLPSWIRIRTWIQEPYLIRIQSGYGSGTTALVQIFYILCRNRPALDDGVCGGSGLGHGLRGIPTHGRVRRPDYGRQRFPGSKY
jgi:hypothetical protein